MGTMTTSFELTAGDDLDPAGDNLTAPLLFAASDKNAFAPGSGDETSYAVSLPVGGAWYAWARSYYPGTPDSNEANSFFLGIDGAAAEKLGNNKDFFQLWHWGGDGTIERGAIAGLALGALAAGPHEVVVEKREVLPVGSEPRLDVLCLSRNGAQPPSDAAACAALGGCGGGSTTTVPAPSSTTSTSLRVVTTTSVSTTSSTVPVLAEAVCIAAGADPTAMHLGSMTTGTEFTGGADLDPARDNLTTPLLFAASTDNSFMPISGDETSYAVTIPAAGNWNAWGRFYYPGAPGSNEANSFFLRVDDGPARKLGNNKDLFQLWHWDGDGAVERGAPAPLPLGALSAGPATITVEKREVQPAGTAPRLDVLCLTPDGAAAPTDAQVCALIGCP